MNKYLLPGYLLVSDMGGPFSRLTASPEATSPTDRYSPNSIRLSSRRLLELYGAFYCPSHLPVLHVLDLGLTSGRSGRPCLRYHFLCLSPKEGTTDEEGNGRQSSAGRAFPVAIDKYQLARKVRPGIHRSHRHESQQCGTGSEHQWHDSSRRLC